MRHGTVDVTDRFDRTIASDTARQNAFEKYVNNGTGQIEKAFAQEANYEPCQNAYSSALQCGVWGGPIMRSGLLMVCVLRGDAVRRGPADVGPGQRNDHRNRGRLQRSSGSKRQISLTNPATGQVRDAVSNCDGSLPVRQCRRRHLHAEPRPHRDFRNTQRPASW